MTRSHLVIVASLAVCACNGLDLSDNYYFETSTSSASGTLVTGQLPSTGDPGTTGGDSTSSGGEDASAGTFADTSTSGPVDPTSSTSSTSSTTGDTSEGPTGTTDGELNPKCSGGSKKSYVFITQYAFPGDLNLPPDAPESLKEHIDASMMSTTQLARADSICQFLAQNAAPTLPGRYVAWLSSGPDGWGTINNIKTFLQSEPSGPAWDTPRYFVRTDGECVAESWEVLASSNHHVPIDLDQNAAPSSAIAVWTGTKDNGDSTITHCGSWSKNGTNPKGTAGDPTTVAQGWSNSENMPCSTALPLYCLQYAD